MTDRYLVVRQSNGQVVFDTDDLSEAQQVKKDCEDVDEQNAYCIADTRITPPTPDLAAVREADFAAADSAAKYAVAQNDAPDGDLANLARAYLALRARPAPLPADVQEVVAQVREIESRAMKRSAEVLVSRHDLRTLLAAVSRPAEARGEPVAATDGLGHTTTGHINPANITPTYAAPRPETGEPSEAMVEAFRCADYCENGKMEHEHVTENCDECVRIGLRAALAARTGTP